MSEFTCPPTHKHAAVSTCYVQHKCRCQPCRAERSRRERHRIRQVAYGRYDNGLVDAEPARQHIEALRSYGMGWKRIGEVSGVGYTAVSSLVYGRKGSHKDPRKGEHVKRITREKAQKILAVKPDLSALSDGALVPATGTIRRLRALMCNGWSQSKLAARLGVELSNFGGIFKRDQITVRMHKAVAALYDELWDRHPAHDTHYELIAYNRTRNVARRNKWVPPLGWDDIDTDPAPIEAENTEAMDEMAVELAMLGQRVKLTTDERREAIRRLHARQWSDKRIAETLGCADRTVLRIRGELGLEGIAYADVVKRGAA